MPIVYCKNNKKKCARDAKRERERENERVVAAAESEAERASFELQNV